MARTTRICLRDAFYRLAEGSRSPRSAAVAEATRYHAQAAVDLSRSLLEILQLVILMLSVSSSPLAAANPLQCVDDAAAPSPRRDRQDGGEPHLQAAAVLTGSRGGDDAAHACLRRPSSPSPDHRRTGGDSLGFSFQCDLARRIASSLACLTKDTLCMWPAALPWELSMFKHVEFDAWFWCCF